MCLLVLLVDSYRIPKILSFFREKPSLWSKQIEASFRHARITAENTKADTVVPALDFDLVAHIEDLLNIDPQPPDIYTQIKNRNVSECSTSSETRQLLKGEVLTAGKPSLVLNRLRSLNDFGCSNEVIKVIFMDHLPA